MIRPGAATIGRMRARRPVVGLVTDFGLRDPSAAIVKGVIVAICQDVRLIDISHEVGRFAIRDGALLLWSALPYLPVGICLAVVDPGVGTARRPIAIRAGRGDVLIGPDNGLLLPALERIGSLVEVRELTNPAFRLEPVSASFHARDIFGPAAGHLAAGAEFGELGPQIDPDALVPLALPRPRVTTGSVETAVIYLDAFGNAKLSALGADLEAALGPLAPGTRLRVARAGRSPLDVAWAATFGEIPAGEPLLYVDSFGRLCLAVNQGSAATAMGLRRDDELRIGRAP